MITNKKCIHNDLSKISLFHKSIRGFTLLEVTVVVAIVAMLASIVSTPFIGLRRQQALNSEIEKVATVVNRARIFTISAKGGFRYGVHFDDSTIPNKLVIFRGPTYVAGASTNEEHPINTDVDLLAPVITGGGSDVVFDFITGATSQDATITLQLLADTTVSSGMVIHPTGIVTLP